MWSPLATAFTLALSQAPQHRYSATLDLGFSQFRDQLGEGLVYHGGQIGPRFGYTHDFDRIRLQWSVRALFGVYASHGMPALTFQLDWLDMAVWVPIRRPTYTIWVGPGVDSDQRWYVNPFLESGHFYWYGHYDLEARAGADFFVARQRFRANLRATAVSMVSRPTPNPDPYFYDWRFTDLVARTHRNMRLGSVGTTRHVEAGLEWLVPRLEHDFGVGYAFRFEDYTPEPALRTTQHLVRLSWHQR